MKQGTSHWPYYVIYGKPDSKDHKDTKWKLLYTVKVLTILGEIMLAGFPQMFKHINPSRRLDVTTQEATIRI